MFFVPQAQAGLHFWPALLSALAQEAADEHFRREMLLQMEIAGDDSSDRAIKRLQEIGPAARAFLTHQRLLTSLGHNPIIHWWERRWLQVFVLNFLELERNLAHQARLRPTRWRTLHEERLVEIVASSDHHFAQVIGYRQMPAIVQTQVVQGLATELGMPGASEASPLQMG